MLYDLNKVRTRSEAMKRSAPKPLLTIFIPFPFVQFFNLFLINMESAWGAMSETREKTRESAFYDAYCSESSDLFSDACELAACDDLFRILVSGGDFLCELAESVEWDASPPF